MTTVKAVQESEPPPPTVSAGHRVWTMTALIFSVLVLLLAVGGLVGAWVGRSVAIDVVTDVMTGVDQLATTGRNGIVQIDTLVTDVRDVVGTVQEAADQASQNVADRGLLLTLLPSDTSQELEALADRIRTTLESILSVVQATADLIDAVGSLPFVDLPQPDEVGALQQEVQAITTQVEQLGADVRQFREEAAAEVATVTERAAQINGRLETTQQNLAALDSELSRLQERAKGIRERFPLWATVTAILLTLIFVWVIYAMVQLIRAYWEEWQSYRRAGEKKFK